MFINVAFVICLCFYVLQLLMLTTNMVRKDLNSQNQYDAGVALSALSCYISSDLARDLANDIMTLVCKLFLFFIILNCYQKFLSYFVENFLCQAVISKGVFHNYLGLDLRSFTLIFKFFTISLNISRGIPNTLNICFSIYLEILIVV